MGALPVTDCTRYARGRTASRRAARRPTPRVVLVPGSACSRRARTRGPAGIVSDIYHHTDRLLGNAGRRHRPLRLALRRRTRSTSSIWPLELYKLQHGAAREGAGAPDRAGHRRRRSGIGRAHGAAARARGRPLSWPSGRRRRQRARHRRRDRGGRREPARPRTSDGRDRGGLGGAARSRQTVERVRRARHRRVERRHRALVAADRAWRSPTGSDRSRSTPPAISSSPARRCGS